MMQQQLLTREYTLEEQIDCIEPELAIRRMVYPRRVAAKKMQPTKADYELGCMSSILEMLWERKGFLDRIGDPPHG